MNQATTTKDRRELILTAAIGVFAHFGFKKTSMDDVARSADISKQGLYLHFASKEQLFVACLKKYLAENHAAMERLLFRADAPLFERLVDAFDSWFTRYTGVASAETRDVVEAGKRLSGAVMDEYVRLFRASLAKALAASAEFKRAKSILAPKEVADVLLRLVESWKNDCLPRAEFRKKVALAVRACVQIEG
jgi:AcrR family transcriptional regulator